MRCRATERAFDSAFPLFPYAGKARELISAYKKGRRRSLGPFIAGLFAEAVRERWPDRVIVPVPPRPGKARAAGWDQVEEIARWLESRGFRVARPLERSRSSEQKRLGRGERGLNARMAYSLKAGEASPLRPLLIDDVVTTCATLDACARALRAGGAATVEALAFAAD
jgi:ComF family protein